jgi:hypothetical protein
MVCLDFLLCLIFAYYSFYVFVDVFKKGILYKGIFCPSLTNSFHSKQLENSYLQYSNRQRQKSLIMLNIIDLGLKVQYKSHKYIILNCETKENRNIYFKIDNS